MDFTAINELCPIYVSEIGKIILIFDSVTDQQSKLNILSEFAYRYTLPPIYWKRLLKITREICLPRDHKIWVHRALSQFRLHEQTQKIEKHLQWNNFDFIRRQISSLDTIENGLKMCEEALTYPHKMLKTIFFLYSRNLLKPISKSVEEIYNRFCELYKKLEAAKNNPTVWLELITQIEDENVVISNIEYYLTININWAKKEIWKKFFEILKATHSMHLLNVYSKYNRLFISDSEMREEYRAAIEEFGNRGHRVAEYWLETIYFEYQFVSEESAYRLIQRILTSLVRNYRLPADFGTFVPHGNSFDETFEFYKNLLLNIDQNLVVLQELQVSPKLQRKIIHFQNPENQQLCFHNTLIRYILKSAKAKILRKLFHSCKYFFALHSTPICYKFSLKTNRTFSLKQESLFLSENEINNFVINNLFISNIFACDSEDPRILSEIISKIYGSNAEFNNIQNQVLYLDELEKLIPFQSAKSLNLQNCTILNRNDTVIDVDTILWQFMKQGQK